MMDPVVLPSSLATARPTAHAHTSVSNGFSQEVPTSRCVDWRTGCGLAAASALACQSRSRARRTPTARAAAVKKETAKEKKLRLAEESAQTPETGDKSKKLKAFRDRINKKHGEGTFMPMTQTDMNVETFSTGALTLDLALGGGLPKGRVVELYGPEQSGKTTTALHCIAGLQKAGGRCAFIDAECAMDIEYAQRLGVNLLEWDLLSPGSAEDATDLAIECAEEGLYDLIAIDSVAALVPQEELDKEMGQMTMGLLARIMSKFMRKITPLVKKQNCTLLLINQQRANIGGYGPPMVTSGGNAIKYAASVRMEVRSPKSGIIGTAEEPTGIRCKVKITKNKLAAPHRTAEFDLTFGKGISWESSVLEAATTCDPQVVQKGGAWLSYGEHKVQGREKFSKLLEDDPALCAEIEAKCRAAERKKKMEFSGAVEPEKELASVAEKQGLEIDSDAEAVEESSEVSNGLSNGLSS